METNSLTLVGALLLGLTTSLHCVGMCGPLACGVTSLVKKEENRALAAVAYHISRIVGYCLVGAAFGALGRVILLRFFHSYAVFLPIVLAVFLILSAFDVDKIIPRPKFLDAFVMKCRSGIGKMPPYLAATTIGLLTVFLPCTPLYLILGAAWLSGSAVKAAEVTLAFGVGTIPLLWLVQFFYQTLRGKLSSKALNLLRRAVTIAAAIVILWRFHGVDALAFGKNKNAEATSSLPSCCHAAAQNDKKQKQEQLPSCCHCKAKDGENASEQKPAKEHSTCDRKDGEDDDKAESGCDCKDE